MIKMLTNLINELNHARKMGLTNDAGLRSYFRAEYKSDPQGAYDYWIANRDSAYLNR